MNTIRELKQQEKYNNMLKRKNKEISILKDDKEHLGEFLKESIEEIERLNNIINKLEKYLNERSEYTNFGIVLDKIKELKGSDKE